MSDGWYVLRAGRVFGPYAWERVLEPPAVYWRNRHCRG